MGGRCDAGPGELHPPVVAPPRLRVDRLIDDAHVGRRHLRMVAVGSVRHLKRHDRRVRCLECWASRDRIPRSGQGISTETHPTMPERAANLRTLELGRAQRAAPGQRAMLAPGPGSAGLLTLPPQSQVRLGFPGGVVL